MVATEREAVPSVVAEKLDRGKIPGEIFADEDIYDLDKERIFEQSWIFLAHESEIEESGDYVRRHVADTELLVVRGADDEVRVFYNICCHQGMRVCRTDKGHSSHFRCPYHGWTYDTEGDLIGVPLKNEAYETEFEGDDYALREAPAYDTYNGLIFANLDEGCEPLEEYLGDFTFFFDIMTGRSREGMELSGPLRRVVDMNWKTVPVNSAGDKYHATITHRSAIKVGAMTGNAINDEGDRELGYDPAEGKPYRAGPGCGNLRPNNIYAEAEWSPVEEIRAALSDEQWQLLSHQGPPGNTALFPNLTFNSSLGAPDEGERVPYSYVRKLRPLGPAKTEVITWYMIERDAPAAVKERSKRAFEFSFGSSGTFVQDDLVNWKGMTSSGADAESADIDLKYHMGLDHEPIEDFPAPGEVFETGLSEVGGRYFLELYLDAMGWEEFDE